MPTEEELFAAVDTLLAGEPHLPAPAERARLRERAGITQARLAQVLQTTAQTVKNWESGRAEPRPPRRQAYQRLLDGWAQQFPPAGAPEDTLTPDAPETPDGADTAAPTPTAAAPTATAPSPAPPATARRFEHGPLAVIDAETGPTQAYCVDGLVLDVPAKSLPALVDWALTEARLGQARLHAHGRDADPLLVLTPSALRRYGLPTTLTDDERRNGRLPDSHRTVRQLARADWKLTRRGLGPWARIYRPADGARRHCVQLCIPAWNALDAREWDDRDTPRLPTMHPADLARYLTTYAQRVMTPRGTAAVTGLELMTALHPPTRAQKDPATGEFTRALNDDALTAVHEAVECEVPDEHPLLKGRFARHHLRTPAEMLMEEPYDWCRPLTDEECMRPYLVAIDINMSFAAAANGLTVGLGGPTHRTGNPPFDPSLPGSWLVDLSHVDLSRIQINGRTIDAGRLPSPFTPKGEHPTGPAWYATPTVAYAVELGFEVAPVEAYVRTHNGRYLDAWYKRLRDAYVATMADLGVTTGMDGAEFLRAMARSRHADAAPALLAGAIKATAKGGIGKLRQRSRGQVPHYEPWPALQRETWRPDIRAAVLANQRVGLHRKLMKTAAAADLYPVAIGTDAVVYPSPGPSPLDVLPHTPEGRPLPGTFRLGISPGMVKHQGTRTVLWAEEQFEQQGGVFNIANHVKNDPPTGEGE
ncbi:transcriptional regulator with XRE-family HTH domain [Streptomyces sp. DSM 40167]|uniref:telomere-associated protein Tap n=1 Tax=Streptomyces sp. DSM 40167 TaxID=2817708 RepID=UPI00277E21E4|nr:helix-turn-helix domain-containing protein [Streptomyces sp. DSM 40167]MDQ0408673.1 transcriptional regulator with XRE-family HTH domain [Streptomyces sp. DSM 40167]